MKTRLLAVLAACMLTTAVPLMAADTGAGTDQKANKDECLLYSKKCATSVDTLQEKIRKLNAELKKGSRTYSAAELKRLDQKLREANDILDSLNRY